MKVAAGALLVLLNAAIAATTGVKYHRDKSHNCLVDEILSAYESIRKRLLHSKHTPTDEFFFENMTGVTLDRWITLAQFAVRRRQPYQMRNALSLMD